MRPERWAQLPVDQRRQHHRWESWNEQRRAQWDADHEGHDIRHGKHGPRCWTCRRGDHDADHVAVARVLAGGRADGLLLAERLDAVKILSQTRKRHGDYLTAGEIAERLGVTRRTVERDIARLRALGPDWSVAA